MRTGEEIAAALPSRPLGRDDLDGFEEREAVERVAAVGLEPTGGGSGAGTGLAIALQVELETGQVYFLEFEDGNWDGTPHDGPNFWQLPAQREERVESRESPDG